MAAMPEKHNKARPPMTPPMIAPVLFVEEPPLLLLPLPPLVSFAIDPVVEGLDGSDALLGDVFVDLTDDETGVVLVAVVEEGCDVGETR
jgi:hypothetical protein